MTDTPDDDEPRIVLTGQMREHDGETQIMAVFDGKDVWLPVEEFRALVDLITAGIKGKSVTVSPAIMESMKRRIDEATGVVGTGDGLFVGPAKKRRGGPDFGGPCRPISLIR